MNFLNYLNSKAKQNTYELLHKLNSPIHLRLISELSNTPLRSTQLVLGFFEKEKMVKKSKKSNKVFYSINRKHESYNFLSHIFNKKEESNSFERAKAYEDLTWQINFLEDAKLMFSSMEKDKSL